MAKVPRNNAPQQISINCCYLIGQMPTHTYTLHYNKLRFCPPPPPHSYLIHYTKSNVFVRLHCAKNRKENSFICVHPDSLKYLCNELPQNINVVWQLPSSPKIRYPICLPLSQYYSVILYRHYLQREKSILCELIRSIFCFFVTVLFGLVLVCLLIEIIAFNCHHFDFVC